ncbi:MAG: 4Fe-4S dicluster domain-containing protein [Planctomycetales bacterium]|nr:4Fe-4S dicluster domain-containing protein [Planctomycetales bacterium]
MIDREQTLERVRQAGVVGAGGAGFPTYKKLAANVDWIIANGAECEPLLQKDRETMLRESDEMLRGLQIMQALTGAKNVCVVVKHKNADVVEALEQRIRAAGFESLVYDDVYPAGDEYVLVHEVTGRQIPPGGIPVQVGCVVDNVETIVNVARAAAGEPVTDKYLTVCGAVRNPLTTRVPIGVSLASCVELAGGATVDRPVALTGGVMMGGLATDLAAPVSKVTGGIIVLPEDHYLFRRKSQAKSTYTRIGHGQCDQCSMCTELCPRYLLGYPIQPHMVMRSLLMTGQPKDQVSLWADYCCGCNVCSLIACPEQLDPARICLDTKQRLKEQQLHRTHTELDSLFRPPHPARKGREIPIQTLYQRLGLTPYQRPADFVEMNVRPASVTIPLATHVGQPAKPAVQVGESVRRGQVIADVDREALGCPVHSSIDGRVAKIAGNTIQINAT